MGKLVSAVLVTFTIVYALLTLGGILALFENPDPGDGYFILYVAIGFALCAGALLWQLFRDKPANPVKLPTQAAIIALMACVAFFGLLSASGLALDAEEPDPENIVLAVAAAIFALGCGLALGIIVKKQLAEPHREAAGVFGEAMAENGFFE